MRIKGEPSHLSDMQLVDENAEDNLGCGNSDPTPDLPLEVLQSSPGNPSNIPTAPQMVSIH